MRIKVSTGKHVFTATLYDNETASAFLKLLPLTTAMKELNGNEKYIDLPNSLPADAAHPGMIHTGDLMLYGSNTLVLFYKSFFTSYAYTKLGLIIDPSGLEAALGNHHVVVTFDLK